MRGVCGVSCAACRALSVLSDSLSVCLSDSVCLFDFHLQYKSHLDAVCWRLVCGGVCTAREVYVCVCVRGRGVVCQCSGYVCA